ncbi:Hypothetical Protein FCC1311_005622 [Hondaea fermentalgiana]|uniref:Uncharacterized protein n=1 Tax=Hondaea fermentalgiana TaxID=2315210 RepID=A0A2R5G9I8_9STRA|nr:Hypothetical Protein FCC1311_005622 [Hondaea fermentalgiana]|eukprot:GBG24344.1 Hypothetical Protein FCC1311_005622 [Hondaea fermentalgiana]
MAKKKAEPAAPAEPEIDEAELIAQVEAETLQLHASELVDKALRAADEELYEEYLDSKEVPFTVEAALRELAGVLEVAFRRPDAGEGDLDRGTWYLGAEAPPRPAQIDTWARGAIPKKRRDRATRSRDSAGASQYAGSVAPSETARSRSRSIASKARRQRESLSSEGKSRKKRGELPEYLVRLDADDSGSTGSNDREARRQSHRRRSSLASATTESAIVQEMEAKKAAAEADRKRRQEEEQAENERAAQLAKDLRDKQFVLDNDGKIIVVNQVAGDKLPRTNYTMSHSVSSDQLEELQKQAVVEDLRRETAHTEALTKAAAKAAAADAEASKSSANGKFYRSSASFQQCILKNPALRVKAGVTIREDGSGVSGPAWEGSDNQMSRSAFLQHQSMLESQVGTGVDGDISFAAPPLPASSSAKSLLNLGQQDAVPERPETNAAAALTGKDVTKAGNGAGSSAEATNAALAGASHGAQAGVSKNRGAAAGQKDEEEMDSLLEDPNLELTNQPTWGQNRNPKDFVPAALPNVSRIDTRGGGAAHQPVLMNSPTRKPRDRVAAETNSIQTSKLPPPFNGSPRSVSKDVQAAASVSASASEYVRDFENVTDRGAIRVENDRAFRLLGLAQPSMATLK